MGLSALGCSFQERHPQHKAAVQDNAGSFAVDGALGAHVAAMRRISETARRYPGLEAEETGALDEVPGVLDVWVRASLSQTPGSWLGFALRLAQEDGRMIEPAIRMVERARRKERSGAFDDFWEYHLGRLCAAQASYVVDHGARRLWQKRARRHFKNVFNAPNSPYFHTARARALHLSVDLGDIDEISLQAFIDDYPDYPQRLRLQLELAKWRYLHGHEPEAVAQIQDLYFWHPHHDVHKQAQAWLAAHRIGDRARSFDEIFDRVDLLRRMRFWDDAQEAATLALEQFPGNIRLMVQNARIAYERSDHAVAVERFASILNQLDGAAQDGVKPSGIIAYLYRAYSYLGNCEKAREYFDMNAAKLGKKARVMATRDFALACGDLKTAHAMEIQLPEPSDGDGLYRRGMSFYLHGDDGAARRYFSMASKRLSGSYQRRALYFFARATYRAAMADQTRSALSAPQDENLKPPKKTKRPSKTSPKETLAPPTKELAQKQFAALIDANGDDYYAILAHSRLAEMARRYNGAEDDMPDTPAAGRMAPQKRLSAPLWRQFSRDFYLDETAYENGFYEGVTRYRALFPALDRVAFLHDARLYKARNALFRVVAVEAMGILRMKSRPSSKRLWTAKLSVGGHLVDNRKQSSGVWGRRAGEFWFDLPPASHKAARAAVADRQMQIYDCGAPLQNFIRQTLLLFHDYYLARRYSPSPKKTCGGAAGYGVCDIFYPHAFHAAVLDAAQNNGVRPELIWALMNIESAFNPDSISHAGAYGLLQIIPVTGYKIADAFGVEGFGPYDLIKPEVSIRMGTWYFARVMRKFHGDASLAMAGYNGGPHQVARWLTAWGGKMAHDAFIELIPYDEARNYVKKGMARMLIFYRIDRHDPTAFFEIPNALSPEFETMPNY